MRLKFPLLTKILPPGTMEDEEDIWRTPPKKKSKVVKAGKDKVTQKFRDEWLSKEEFKSWLKRVPHNPYKARCKLCNQEYTADISVLHLHRKTDKHLNNEKPLKKTSMQMAQFVQRGDGSGDPLETAAKIAEIKIAGFCAEHNIAYKALDHLSDLLKSCFLDSKICQKMTIKRTKGTCIVKNVIGETEKSILSEKLKKTKFSILTDESTDISSTKTSWLLVRYFDEDQGQIVSKFWDLIQVLEPGKATSATAEHLYNNIITSFNEREIPMENVIGFASDGCSVMMGVNNSVSSRLKPDFPHITIIKCICHSLHLCASEACKQLPRTCEDFA